MVLQAITWYLMVFNNIRWYCMVFDGIAGYYMVFIGISPWLTLNYLNFPQVTLIYLDLLNLPAWFPQDFSKIYPRFHSITISITNCHQSASTNTNQYQHCSTSISKKINKKSMYIVLNTRNYITIATRAPVGAYKVQFDCLKIWFDLFDNTLVFIDLNI